MELLQRRIAHALYLQNWKYEDGLKVTLLKGAQRIQPSEYEDEMKNALFCPVCFTNIIRVPQNKEHTTSNKEAHFRHIPKYKNILCELRSKKAEGKKYSSVEAVTQAIDHEELVIVSSFMKDKPEQTTPSSKPFNDAQIDDEDGPDTEVPLSIHNGETFKVPSKITSLRGICHNFDKNYYRYYFLPDNQHSIALTSLLNDASLITDIVEKPKLYFVKLKNSLHHGNTPGDNNIRMTYIESAPTVKDFCIKTKHKLQHEHGIGDKSTGRYALVYSKVTKNGIGLCFENLGWGELALLPEKYNYLIDDVYSVTHAKK